MNDARVRRANLQKRLEKQKPKMTHERLADLVEEYYNPKVQVFVFLDNQEVMIADASAYHICRTVQRSADQGLWFTDGFNMTFVPGQSIRRIGIFKKDGI